MPTTITLDQTSPAFGDTVTFTVSPDPLPGGWIYLEVVQDGKVVLAETHAAYDDGSAYGYHQPFQLGPTNLWQGGAAQATAELVVAKKGSIHRVRPEASVSFNVN